MKVISLHQPWASLCVTRQPCARCGSTGLIHDRFDQWACPDCCPDKAGCTPMVKRIETRSWPCPPALVGQPLAIHATARKPRGVVGGFAVSSTGDRLIRWEPQKTIEAVSDLPLGAVVGSGRIAACLPIEQCSDDVEHICESGYLMHHRPLDADEPTEFDVTDQLPYGDFTSGRYAWLIEDAAPTTERCLWCWGDCDIDGMDQWLEYHTSTCPVCDGAGRCEPIPAKGRQRVWEWTVHAQRRREAV